MFARSFFAGVSSSGRTLHEEFREDAAWLALMALAIVSTPRSAQTAPPPEPHPHTRAALRQLQAALDWRR